MTGVDLPGVSGLELGRPLVAGGPVIAPERGLSVFRGFFAKGQVSEW